MAMLVQELVPERRPPQPVAEAIPSILPTQHQTQDVIAALQSQLRTNSVAIITQLQQLRMRQYSVTGLVDNPFLYDGVRPQDLERMNPPRRGLVAPPPPNELKK